LEPSHDDGRGIASEESDAPRDDDRGNGNGNGCMNGSRNGSDCRNET